MSNSISRAAVHAAEWSSKVPHSEIFAAEGLSSWKEKCNQKYPLRFGSYYHGPIEQNIDLFSSCRRDLVGVNVRIEVKVVSYVRQ